MEPDEVSRRIAVRPAVAKLNAMIWGGCAAVSFAAAMFLTWLVVHGRYDEPNPAESQVFTPYFRYDDVRLDIPPSPPPQAQPLPSQLKSRSPSRLRPAPGVLAKPAIDFDRLDALSALFAVNFKSRGSSVVLSLQFPPGIDAKILTNNLVGNNPCRIEEQAAPSDPTTLALTSIDNKAEAPGRLWVISLTPAHRLNDILIRGWTVRSQYPWVGNWSIIHNGSLLECTVRLPVTWETFATRRMIVGEYVVRNPDGYGVASYTPATNIEVDFEHMAGLENVQFFGGHSWAGSPLVESPEQWRGIGAGATAVVTWHDLGREGERDSIFVIIGALIAIAAGMAVEAARPYIERYVEQRDQPQPTPQTVPPPPTGGEEG